ncbi:hypothetical protein F4777DRAFT_519668 [Nemania sp. FL0916]|nr:hypothetical protein F4777DRAFT_519668 [Nemania sp. FL0916]
MRFASRALRNVQLRWPISHAQFSPLLVCSRSCVSDNIGGCVVRAGHGIHVRSLSVSPSLGSGSVSDYDLIHPEPLRASRPSNKAGVAPEQTTSRPLVLEANAFRRWRAMLDDPARLAVESDFSRHGPAKDWPYQLRVDKFENRGDLALWSCLLDYQMRIYGSAGVAHVWGALWGRKTLYTVDGPLADTFWRIMLEGALVSDDPGFLDQVWVYSEWMCDLHQSKWPQLYTTIIRHLLRTHQHQRALQWHVRLMPNFDPGADEFARIIKDFVLDTELYRLDTLPSLYKTSQHRNLYDALLPYLFNLGQSKLARHWRRILIRHGEVPLMPTPLRPFLRFMKGYYPNDTLTGEERAVLKFAPELTDDEKINLSREFMNRVHGQTFGISVKGYSDQLGARWFASSWVSLDTAISTVSALGVENIGPLSLQSIALRAAGSGNLLDRIAQLRENGISVRESNYVHIILYLARQNDDELLGDLLQSDFHPDVFDDLDLQTRLMDSAASKADWRTFRLLFVARLVAFARSAREIANSVLRICFENRSTSGVIRILEEMRSRRIPLNVDEASHIYDSLVEDYNHCQRSLTSKLALFYLSIFRQLKSMDVPVPLSHWKLVMLSMVRRGQLEDLERLSVELVDMFVNSPSLRPGFVPLHIWDLPMAIKAPLHGVENLLGVYIPQDIPGSHENHPLRELFNSKVVTEMIEGAFTTHSGQRIDTNHDTSSSRRQSQASKVSRMVQLFRVLHERGLYIRFRKIKFVMTNCLVKIYGPAAPADTPHRLMRAGNALTLKEMKLLIDEAWGRQLLPSYDELMHIIWTRDPRATLLSRKSQLTKITS